MATAIDSDAAGPASLDGLTQEAAAQRLADDGPNELPTAPEPRLAVRVARQVLDPLSLVLLAASLASIAVLGHTAEGLAIAAIVVLNVTIGTAQERRASSAVAALEDLTAPTARVRRSGRTAVIPARHLVVGDVVELAAGDRVPADLTLLEAVSLAVDEAILTGESLPATKLVGEPSRPDVPLGDRAGDAFASTLVVRGRGIGLVTRTGADTAVGAIATSLGRATPPPLVAELRSVAARMSTLAIVLGALLVPVVLARAGDDPDPVVTAVLAGVALAVAAIPEGLATIVTTSLALGARRMAARGAIVRRLPAIEALGAADVICSDKTGTITTGKLTVSAVIFAAGRDDEFWQASLRCNDAVGGMGDPIDVALRAAAEQAGAAHPGGTRVAERPFDADTRTMTTVHQVGDTAILSVKGAPEDVLRRCQPGPARQQLESAYTSLATEGLRVLALAAASTDDMDSIALEPLGLAAFHDPLRPSAIDAIAQCRAAGIRVVLVTGDHIDTARSVASAAGIEGPAVTGADLAALSPGDRDEALRSAAVIARVDPATKVALVDAHRAAGRVVAMTGDGVNDAPALRRADIGVALAGEGGTDVAREAAAVVVTDGDLGTLVSAVREGRRIYSNLRAVVGYLVTGNISEVLTVLLTLAVLPELAVPLLPVQLLWINLITDGLPALALGVDQPASDPLAHRPRGRDGRLLPLARLGALAIRGALMALAVVGSGLVARRWGWSDAAVRTQLLLTLLVAHLLLAYTVRATRWTFERGCWRNRVLLAAVGGSVLLQLLAFGTGLGRSLLGLAPVPPAGWVLASIGAATALAAIDLTRRWVRR